MNQNSAGSGRSSPVFHYSNNDGRVILRHPAPLHEVRQFLGFGELGPYGFYSTNSTKQATDVLIRGFRFQGATWHYAFGAVRPEGVRFVLTPEKLSLEEVTKRLALVVNLTDSKLALKAGKRVSRIMSRHNVVMMQGMIIAHREREQRRIAGSFCPVEGKLQEYLIKLRNGADLRILEHPGWYTDDGEGLLVDGLHFLSRSCVHKLTGLWVPEGSGFSLTTISPSGINKGHAFVRSDHNLNYDAVLFGGSDLLQHTGQEFTFGLLNRLKATEENYTDIQSVISFGETPFLEKNGVRQLEEALVNLQDEESYRRSTAFYSERSEGGEPDWQMKVIAQSGITMHNKPALRRMLFGQATGGISAQANRVRVKEPKDETESRYLIIDPELFNGEAEPVRQSSLSGDQLSIPGVIGPVEIYRQPNAHQDERYSGTAVALTHHLVRDQGVFGYYGPDNVRDLCTRCGGGDQDDRYKIKKAPHLVEHYRQLPAYPVADPESDKDTSDKPDKTPARLLEVDNPFLHLLPQRKLCYDINLMKDFVYHFENYHTPIGMVVNPIMLDNLLSQYKTEVLEYLLTKVDKDPRAAKAYDAFEAYELYTLRAITPRLEEIIDATNQGSGATDNVRQAIRQYWERLPVVPRCFLRGGFNNEGRLPVARRGDLAPYVVETPLCRALDTLALRRKQLDQVRRLTDWQLVREMELPQELLTYRVHPKAKSLASEIDFTRRRLYAQMLKAAESDSDRKKVHREIDEELYRRFAPHPLINDAMIELYRRVYSIRRPQPPVGEDGLVREFPDSILWSQRMSRLTLSALDKLGLLGWYELVDFLPHQSKAYRDVVLDVDIIDGCIKVGGGDAVVGFVEPGKFVNGRHQMDHGRIFCQTPRDLHELEDTRLLELIVVNGWQEKGCPQEEIMAWKQAVNSEVTLVPKVFVDPRTEKPEHAVEVRHNGVFYGHLTRKGAMHVVQETTGYLVAGESSLTMGVVLHTL